MTALMTKAERLELGKVVRLRAKVAKDDAEAQGRRLLADFEAQLAARYPENNPAWAEITTTARRAVEDADVQIAQLCRSFGIPEEFRPRLSCNWCSRGENAEKQRRVELRAVAQREVAARVQTAKVTIDRQAAALLSDLAANALETEHAKAFLEQLPSIDELMPRLGLSEVETLALSFGKEYARLGLSA